MIDTFEQLVANNFIFNNYPMSLFEALYRNIVFKHIFRWVVLWSCLFQNLFMSIYHPTTCRIFHFKASFNNLIRQLALECRERDRLYSSTRHSKKNSWRRISQGKGRFICHLSYIAAAVIIGESYIYVIIIIIIFIRMRFPHNWGHYISSTINFELLSYIDI